MESEFLDRIPWERKHYIKLIIPHSGIQFIKCLRCEKSFLDEEKQIQHFILHLNKVHGITELTEHPEREFFKENFMINTLKSIAVCRICHRRSAKKEIAYSQHGLYLLRNHFEMYHEKDVPNYELIMKIVEVHQILNKYFLKGNEAACPKCNQKIDMTHLKTQTAKVVKELFDHYIFHRYKKKCFIFITSRKSILFYLLCSNNLIIIRHQRTF